GWPSRAPIERISLTCSLAVGNIAGVEQSLRRIRRCCRVAAARKITLASAGGGCCAAAGGARSAPARAAFRACGARAARASRTRQRARTVVFIFQSGGPSQHETFDPKPEALENIRGEYGTTQTRLPGVRFCEHLPRLAQRADRFAIVRTMHHLADRQFRNEHLSCMYLLHTGSTEIPPGDTNASIAGPRPGRFEWPSLSALIPHAMPPAPGVGLPPVIELPRANLMHSPGRGAGILGPRYERWGVDLAPLCRAPDPAGSCPNCFSHDDPNDPARAAGEGPK